MNKMSAGVTILRMLAVLLILKVVVAALLNWRDYFPPDFQSDFLLGRSNYFFGWYRWAFYTHIISGPLSLLLGMLLLSPRLRSLRPALHRQLGKAQIACVLGFVAPSGLAMAYHANTGAVAGIGFAAASALTIWCVSKGWIAAANRQFSEHQRWMERCFMLLCSAVSVRVIGGFSEWVGLVGTYPYAAWIGWLVPLITLEAARRIMASQQVHSLQS